MNKRLKKTIFVLITILFLAACGQPETTSTPELIVTENPTNIPTSIPLTGLAPEKFSKYIGLTYPPLPAELSERFSMIIQDSNVYGLSMVVEDDSKMLWLIKMSQGNETSWEVKDILDLSGMEAGLILIPDGCSLNGTVDNEIFVVVGNNGTIRLAWRANTSLDIFQLISTSGIVCNSDKGVSIN
jgi:hypothetical protein